MGLQFGAAQLRILACLTQAKDGGYVLVGSEDSQIWLAKIVASAQSSGGFLVETVLAAVAVAVIVVLFVVFIIKRRRVSLKKRLSV